MDIKNSFIKVTNPDGSIAVADYFENVKVETNQVIQLNNEITPDNLIALPDDGWIEKGIYLFENKIIYCIQPHNRTIYSPEETPALFKNVHSDGNIWVQPLGAHDAYNLGDRVTHLGKIWESTVNANVWEPSIYGWTEIL